MVPSPVFSPLRPRYCESVNPFRTAVPFLGTNQSNFKVVCPQNGTAALKGLSRRWKMLADMKLNGTFEISAVTVENPNCAHSNFSYFWYLVKRAPYRTPYIFPALTTLLNLQVLKWAVENGCPWDKRVRDFMPGGACGFMALHQVRNIRDTLSEIAMYLIFRRSTHVCIPGV